ncbi:MAG: hypothetical protein HWN65_19035 [Candidatus Helarchaeota archaeon]|nr:hypothetical protein [Candidatus Helarchaeota archaeon]
MRLMKDLFDTTPEIFNVRVIFNICLIVSLIIFALYLFIKRRREDPGSRTPTIFLGYAVFLICYSITRIFFVFSDFEVYTWSTTTTELNTIYVGLAYSFGILGAICLFIIIERYLVHTKYGFTILGIVVLIMSLLSTFSIIVTEVPQTIITIVFPLFFAIIVLLYVYVAIKAMGEPRRRALGIVLGLLVMMLGFLLGSSLIGNLLDPIGGFYEIRILIEPFVIIIGSAIFTFSQR